MFAANRTTVAYSVLGTGALDRGALATAFQALVRAFPLLGARLVPDAAGWVVEPVSRVPALRDGLALEIPATGFDVVDADAVCALDLVQRSDHFRLTWLTHHSVADARPSLRYLQVLCELYTDTVQMGRPRALPPHPLPRSLEAFLAERGFDVPTAPAAPAARPRDEAAATPGPRFRDGRTRLAHDDTRALFDVARAHGLTVHGIVCAVILLAARELSASPEFGVVSSVDLRTRAGEPLAPEAGTVIQGLDTAVITVGLDDDPIRLGAVVLDSLSANLTSRKVHETFLRNQQVRPRTIAQPLMVTNWGRIPPLPLPSGIRVRDFRAFARGLRMDRAQTMPPSFFITTCDGRLSIDHPAWATDDADPTLAWNAALQDAVRRVVGRRGVQP